MVCLDKTLGVVLCWVLHFLVVVVFVRKKSGGNLVAVDDVVYVGGFLDGVWCHRVKWRRKRYGLFFWRVGGWSWS